MPNPELKPKGLLDRPPLHHPNYPPAPEPVLPRAGSSYPKHVNVQVANAEQEKAALELPGSVLHNHEGGYPRHVTIEVADAKAEKAAQSAITTLGLTKE